MPETWGPSWVPGEEFRFGAVGIPLGYRQQVPLVGRQRAWHAAPWRATGNERKSWTAATL